MNKKNIKERRRRSSRQLVEWSAARGINLPRAGGEIVAGEEIVVVAEPAGEQHGEGDSDSCCVWSCRCRWASQFAGWLRVTLTAPRR